MKKGVFVGLDARRKPIFLPRQTVDKNHLEILGESGVGKSSFAGVVLSQLAAAGETVVIFGRVEMWRGSSRFGLSVSAPFVWRCLSNRAITPFPHPSHRTGHADFPHPALGQDLTPSHTPRCASSRAQTYEPKVPVKVREWIRPAPTSSDLVLVAQPPAQPRCRVAVDRTIRSADVPYTKVVSPAA